MGGGGGSWYSLDNPEKMKNQVRKAEGKVHDANFETAIAGMLTQLLVGYNDRDTGLIKDRLNKVKDMISDELEGTIDILFGGSVAKKTYIDGFSDIDTLIIINKLDIANNKPHDVLAYMENLLHERLPDDIKISSGRIAITIEYPDKAKIQLLPTLRSNGGLKVPSWKSNNTWSDIDPEKFQRALTKRNDECAGKLIPTIKLAKAINVSLPEEQQLSGYHIESLAISAFRNYTGDKTTPKMIGYFFDKAKDLVLSPIKDKTGQSIHVDNYLGVENSAKREQTSFILNRISKRIKNAQAAKSKELWSDLFNQ